MKAKRFKDRELVHVIKPYGIRLHVVVSEDLKRSYLQRELTSRREVEAPYAFVWSRKGCGDIYAFLPEKCGLGATAHEMLHVVDFVMTDTGVGYNDEVWAYHLEEIVQVAAEFVHIRDKNKYRKVAKKARL